MKEEVYDRLDAIKHHLHRALYCDDYKRAVKDSISELESLVVWLDREGE